MLTLAWPGFFFVIKVGLERMVKVHVLAKGISESKYHYRPLLASHVVNTPL